MVDPWDPAGGPRLPDKPDYAGLLTFAGMPYTQSAASRGGRMSRSSARRRTTSSPTGRARASARAPSAPPAARRAAPGGRRGCLRRPTTVIDFGDAPSVPADAEVRSGRSRRPSARSSTRGPCRCPRRRPLDHRADRPRGRAVTARRARPLRHAHGHGRGVRRRAAARNADVPARRGRPRRPAAVRADRAARLLAGEAEFAWQGERGITSFFSTTSATSVSSRLSRRTEVAGRAVFLTVDVDVLDPAFAPGTGRPSQVG